MTESKDDDLLRENLGAIGAWGDPGAVPRPELLVDRPAFVDAPSPDRSSKRLLVVGAAVFVVALVGLIAIRPVGDDPALIATPASRDDCDAITAFAERIGTDPGDKTRSRSLAHLVGAADAAIRGELISVDEGPDLAEDSSGSRLAVFRVRTTEVLFHPDNRPETDEFEFSRTFNPADISFAEIADSFVPGTAALVFLSSAGAVADWVPHTDGLWIGCSDGDAISTSIDPAPWIHEGSLDDMTDTVRRSARSRSEALGQYVSTSVECPPGFQRQTGSVDARVGSGTDDPDVLIRRLGLSLSDGSPALELAGARGSQGLVYTAGDPPTGVVELAWRNSGYTLTSIQTCVPGSGSQGQTEEATTPPQPGLSNQARLEAETIVADFLARLRIDDIDGALGLWTGDLASLEGLESFQRDFAWMTNGEVPTIVVNPSWAWTTADAVVTVSEAEGGFPRAASFVLTVDPATDDVQLFRIPPTHITVSPAPVTEVRPGEQLIFDLVPVEGGARAFLGTEELSVSVDHVAFTTTVQLPSSISEDVAIITLSISGPETSVARSVAYRVIRDGESESSAAAPLDVIS